MTEFSRRGFLQLGAAAAAQSSRPNILFIMADQLRYDCLGANGNRPIWTPNLDRLAVQSANFSNAFVQSPVCVPSRISFFTGRYPHSHRNRVNYTPYDVRETLLQKRLHDVGYRTGSVGKLHFSPPTAEHARTSRTTWSNSTTAFPAPTRTRITSSGATRMIRKPPFPTMRP